MRFLFLILLPMFGCVSPPETAYVEKTVYVPVDFHNECMTACESSRDRTMNDKIEKILKKTQKYCYGLCNKEFKN